MSVFEEKYSSIYESIYKTKDYQGEAKCVEKILSSNPSEVKKILSFGCGTGIYDFILAENGFQIIGVDRSKQMLRLAISKRRTDNPTFLHVDDFDMIEDHSMDASVCLFDVFSYFTNSTEITEFFDLINKKSKSHTLLIFDFWYLPSVIHLKPETRKKHFFKGKTEIIRICEPSLDVSNSCVKATHSFFVKDEDRIDSFSETHQMRCYTKNELCRILDNHGFELKSLGTWNNPHLDPTLNDWSALAVAAKIT